MQFFGHGLPTGQLDPPSAPPVRATTYQGCSHSLGSRQLAGHLGVLDPLNAGLRPAAHGRWDRAVLSLAWAPAHPTEFAGPVPPPLITSPALGSPTLATYLLKEAAAGSETMIYARIPCHR
jgi:hypothetical protein